MNGQFNRYGDGYQLRLDSAADILALQELDEPFWIATSAPGHQLRIDPKLLQFLDADKDDRILSGDIRRALGWMLDRLAVLDGVVEGAATLVLAHLSDNDAGKTLLRTARRVLENLHKEAADTVSLAEVRDQAALFRNGLENGDGVVPLDAPPDDDLRSFLADLAIAVGTVTDRAGKPGIDQAKLDAFITGANALLEWDARAAADGAGLFPLGDGTRAAHAQFCGLRKSIDTYFILCRSAMLRGMLDQEPRPPLFSADATDPAELTAQMRAAPLARPRRELVLMLDDAINPCLEADLARFTEMVLIPVLGPRWCRSRLTEADWQQVCDAFAPFEGWLAAKPGGDLEKLGVEVLRRHLESDLADRLRALIAADRAVGDALSALDELECLLVLQQGFLDLCRNFVNFHDLYDPQRNALFEQGKLVIGGRLFNFSMRVADVAAHSAAAADSGILLLYSEVTGPKPADRFDLVTPVTSMTLGRLKPGRRGVFFHLDGRQLDTRVVKVLDNPVSLWDAIVKPFARLGAALAASFEKVVSGTEKHMATTLTKSAGEFETEVKKGLTETSHKPVAPPAAAPPPTPEPPAREGGARDWLFAGSMATAALGSSFAFIAHTVQSLDSVTPVVIVVVAGLGLILIPTILLADYRLHHRNLGALLEASGWAINAEMRVTRRLARMLAPRPIHPAGIRKVSGDVLRRLLPRA